MKTMVFIPARNVEKAIEPLLRRVGLLERDLVQKVLIVDDCSEDATGAAIEEFVTKERDSRFSILRNNSRLGYGGVQKLAFSIAVKEDYDFVVMVHGDGQYPPEFAPELVRTLERTGAAMAFGSRMTGRPLAGGMSLLRFFMNKLLTAFENWCLSLRLSEFHSGFRGYNCSFLKEVPFEKCSNDFLFDTEIIVLLRKKRLKIEEFTIPTRYGPESNSIGLFKGFIYCVGIVKTMIVFLLEAGGFIGDAKRNEKVPKEIKK